MDIIIINGYSFQKHCEADVFEKTKVFQCTASLYAHLPVHSSETRPIMTFFLVLRSL